jgi:hypothetical protein
MDSHREYVYAFKRRKIAVFHCTTVRRGRRKLQSSMAFARGGVVVFGGGGMRQFVWKTTTDPSETEKNPAIRPITRAHPYAAPTTSPSIRALLSTTPFNGVNRTALQQYTDVDNTYLIKKIPIGFYRTKHYTSSTRPRTWEIRDLWYSRAMGCGERPCGLAGRQNMIGTRRHRTTRFII